jgi:hypothetical protein
MRQSSSKAKRYQQIEFGFRECQEYSFRHIVQTSSGVLPAAYVAVTRGPFPQISVPQGIFGLKMEKVTGGRKKYREVMVLLII